MADLPPLTVSADVLRWAREQRGLTVEVAAKRLSIKVERLLAIEAGEVQPSLPQLRHMSEQYKRPLIVLLLDSPPTTFTPLRDFRRLPDADTGHYSPALHDEMKRAVDQQEVYADLRSQLGQEVSRPELPSDPQNPAKLAGSLIALLDINAEDRASWGDGRVALNNWRQRVESLEILVLETSRVDMREMRGFSLSAGLPLVIAMNGGDGERGKIFTLMHELAHLSMRQSAVCDMHNRATGASDAEIYCNAVAGEALLPQLWLEANAIFKRHDPNESWSDSELEQVSRQSGGASQEVVLRRLRDLRLMSQADYEARRAEYLAVYQARRAHQRERSSGGPAPHVMQIRDRGRPFIRSAFDAYADGLVNMSQLVDLVGVRTKHLERLQLEAYK